MQHHTEKCDDDEDGEKSRRQICPCFKPALRIENSLRKTASGGAPVMANPPKMSAAPAMGDLRISPRTAAISRVPTAINAAPAAKKQNDLVIE